MKIEIKGKFVVIKLRRPDVRDAWETIRENAETPPNGYRWTASSIKRRNKSGRAVNLEITLEHCDRRLRPFTLTQAYDFFDGADDPVTGPAEDRPLSSPRDT